MLPVKYVNLKHPNSRTLEFVSTWLVSGFTGSLIFQRNFAPGSELYSLAIRTICPSMLSRPEPNNEIASG